MGILKEFKNNKYKVWKSICTGFIFTTMGLRTGIIGPTMLDLQLLVNTTVDQITHILPIRAFGGLVGSVTCGLTLHFMDHQIALLINLFLSGFGLFLVPFARTLNELIFVIFFIGFTGGYLDNCGNIYILHQWGKENAPFMQLIHFSFGLRAFIAPFIAQPFLKPVEEPMVKKNCTNILNSSFNDNQVFVEDLKTYIDPKTLKVKYSYFIISFYSFFIFLLFLATYLKNKSNDPHPSREIKLKDEKRILVTFIN